MPQLTRRHFLAAMGANAVALGACSDGPRSSPAPASSSTTGSGQPDPVVVVGAGLAGLSAASRLTAEGVGVRVLEASGRVGGRTWTLSFAGGQVANAGGEFVNGEHVRLRELVEELGLDLIDSWEEAETPLLLHRDGDTMELVEYFVRTPGALEGMPTFRGAVDALVGDIDIDDPTRSEDAGALDDQSVGEVLDGLDLSPGARFLVDQNVLAEYMVDPYRLSWLYYLQVSATNWEELEPEAWRIRGGSQRVSEGLAERVERLELGRRVRRLDDRGDRVVLHAVGGTIAARKVIVATPLGPLRSVHFDERLPDDLAAAVAECGYGVGGKILLQYAGRWWRDGGWTGEATTDLDIGALYEATVGQDGAAGILSTYTAGPAGVAAARLDADARIAAAARDIAELTEPEGAVIGSASVLWHRDPLAGGSYVAFGPGQVGRFWNAVRAPVGNVHWAGEHTDTRSGYMEGAIRSGYRAAEEVLERL